MDRRPLMQCRPDRPVESVLQVHDPLILDHVGEKVSEKC